VYLTTKSELTSWGDTTSGSRCGQRKEISTKSSSAFGQRRDSLALTSRFGLL
jgi:hypothetical protein